MPQDAQIKTRVPISIGDGVMAEFCSFTGLVDGKEHIALVFGDVSQDNNVLVRIHSECLTGDVFHSRHCDCGAQLDDALMRVKDGGVLLYLRQEGRGIGLYEKLEAYALQIHHQQDTYKANEELGHGADERDFTVAGQMLKALGIVNIRLMTNNPNKLKELEASGISVVERLPTSLHITDENVRYLSAKTVKGSHQFLEKPDDVYFMRHALGLAEDGLGRTAPNPSVGCVIVKGYEILGEGRTADRGRPHAEMVAIDAAGQSVHGATLYVTLEPCNHQGQTAPCVDAIIKAGIARVVVACEDPHVSTNGSSIQKLRDQGIEVKVGLLRDEALEINRGFFLTLEKKRPLVTLKVATSLDGKIATSTGHSQWITGKEARTFGHVLRAKHDGVLVGSGTFLADQPQLTVRHVNYDGPEIRRFVLDRSRRIENAEGFEVLAQEKLEDSLSYLAEQGITRILVEGGGQVLTSFLRLGFWDDLYWFRSGKIIGNDGLCAFDGLSLQTVDDAVALNLKRSEKMGDDLLEVWGRKKAL